ncbi:hypothetical protein PG989_006874 [Apiospora arundinis]
MSFRPGSAAAERTNNSSGEDSQPDRPSSPKSRNASRSRPYLSAEDLIAEQRQGNLSRNSITMGALGDQANKVPMSMFNTKGGDSPRPGSRAGHHGRSNSITDRLMDRPGSRNGDPWNRGNQNSRFDRPPSRSMYRSQASNIPEAMSEGAPSRTTSRGRQPDLAEGPLVDGKRVVPPDRSQSRRGMNRPDGSMSRGRPREQRSMSNHGVHEPFETEITRVSPNCPVHGSNHHSASPPQAAAPPAETPQDIVETEIIRTSPSCPVHGQHRRPSSSRQSNIATGSQTPPGTQSSPNNIAETPSQSQAAVPPPSRVLGEITRHAKGLSSHAAL